MNVARSRTSKPPKAPPVVAVEVAAVFVPPPVLVPPQVFHPRAIYRCPHCGAEAKRAGRSPDTTASFRCTRCGTCPRDEDLGTGCGRPGARLVGDAFHCGHCATRNGRNRAFPKDGNETRFKLPVARS